MSFLCSLVRLAGGEHGCEMTLPRGAVYRIGISGGSAVIEASTWRPEFGVSKVSQQLAIAYENPTLGTNFRY